MNYIVFDLEFNQDFPSVNNVDQKKSHFPFEIIQVGAVALDSDFNMLASYDRYVKPTIYATINPMITEMTGITTEQLLYEEPFPVIFREFSEFIGGIESVFCVWGMSDIKELFKNANYHQLNTQCLPRYFINLQPYVSKHFNLPHKKLLRLQHAVEALNIPITDMFHQAFYDARYTAEIFKKIYNPFIEPKFYDPDFVKVQIRQQKRTINFQKLFEQFTKMYGRELTEEEQSMIQLAYKMGKSNQFLE